MKSIIYVLMFVLFAVLVASSPCLDNVNANVTCQMVTPTLTCSNYNYSVFNNESVTVQSGNLSVFKENIYYFNFSSSVGTYVVKLCDGSTRQIQVGGGDTMFLIAIILLPILAIFGLLYWASQLSEEHAVLKALFQMLTIPLLMLSILLGVNSVGIFYPQATALIDQLANFAYYLSLLLYLVGAYILIWLGIKVFDMIQAVIMKKKEEKYG